jgi:hypothetical protein
MVPRINQPLGKEWGERFVQVSGMSVQADEIRVSGRCCSSLLLPWGFRDISKNARTLCLIVLENPCSIP